MYRVLWELPGLGLKVPSFSVALVVACFGSLYLTVSRARREGIDTEAVYGLAVWLMTGGFLGARGLYLVSHPESLRSLSVLGGIGQGGIVYYGCIIGGLIGSVLYWYRSPFPFRRMADAVAPALALGCAIGRVGCLLNGCCYGALSGLPWAVAFPAGTLPWARQVESGLIAPSALHSLPLHPTQLYAALDGLLLLGLLTAYHPRRRRDGEVMALLMVSYPVTRFLIEGLRDDEPAVLGGLTLSQVLSVVVFLGGLVAWACLLRTPAGRASDGSRTRRLTAASRPTAVTPQDVAAPETVGSFEPARG
jgi:phosphatidylglycerol:prolipoprotein diacylglycerol transferase